MKLICETKLASTLAGVSAPTGSFQTTDGTSVDLSKLTGTTVLYIYPRTSSPDAAPLEGWDEIPGARGCTPQSCSFRNLHDELRVSGADHVFGLSSQNTTYQREMADRLHLPYLVLSDPDTLLERDLMLPTFELAGLKLYKRITIILSEGKVRKVFFPIEKPAQNAQDVLDYLRTCLTR